MNRTVYKKFWGDSLVNLFLLNVTPGQDPERVRSEILRRFGREKNLMAMSSAEIRAQMQEAIQNTFAYTRAIELASLLIGLLGMLQALFVAVLERTREIAILRAIRYRS